MVIVPEIKQNQSGYDTVALNRTGDAIRIIDQTRLPGEEVFLELRSQEEIRKAICLLQVRGAPALGVAAGFGYYLAARQLACTAREGLSAAGGREKGREALARFFEDLSEAKASLKSARPTAVNLGWALDRMERAGLCLARRAGKPFSALTESGQGRGAAAEKAPGRERAFDPEETAAFLREFCLGLKAEALAIYQEDIDVCRAIGEKGLGLISPGWGILTHCNAGRLACVRYGTATSPIYLAQEKGYGLKVFVDETRPLLQGARLTAYELKEAGVDATLICDNMAAAVMAKGWVQAVFTGADRVAANGDAANKIGTSGLAILAKHYGIPMYICAPRSTIDFQTAEGGEIRIEERPAEEVRGMWYEKPMAPEGVKIYNPAFDVTDHNLISGIVTEFGVIRPPYRENLAVLRRPPDRDREKGKGC
ncbi:MAG: S-methyl-5-thioribose-1-phosphate isomerase [Peptococcaceae bacterium]|nr:S-methyl-5-thioribose-1-phosphate isomerase [Peptococcaceae bacterium]